MTLPNLARIREAATALASYHAGETDEIPNGQQTVKDRAALIAAAPEMARLLQECAEALVCDNTIPGRGWCHWPGEPMCGRCSLLARLAEFDRGLA